jgi:putative addiction module killer protein
LVRRSSFPSSRKGRDCNVATSDGQHFERKKWFSGIGEYRIDWGPGYRIYLAKDGDDLIILFGGGTKKSQRGDIERARVMWAEYKLRKNAARPRH